MKFRNLIGVCLSFVIVVWLAITYDFSELWAVLQAANFYYVIPLPVLIVISFIVRSIRWKELFFMNPSSSLWSMFSSMMVGYLFNNVLPARAGELVRVYMLGKKESLSKSAILGTIIVEKVVDLLVIMVLLLATIIYFPFPEWIKRAGWTVGIAAICASGVIAFLAMYGNKILDAVIEKLPFEKMPFIDRIRLAGDSFVLGIKGLVKGEILFKYTLYTTLLWGFELAIAALVANALGVQISTGELLFVILVIVFGTTVPSSPGYVGTFELFGVTALGLIGIEGAEALSFVVMLHAVIFLGSSIPGVFCLTADRLFSHSYDNVNLKEALNEK